MVYDRATIKPAVNQVELHPYLQQWEHKAVCDKLGVYMMAFSTLGADKSFHPPEFKAPMLDPVIIRIAEEHKKTPAQVIIRWAIQRGTICIPKSVHTERIIENAGIFDFELSEKEMEEMRSLDKGYRLANPTMLFPDPSNEAVWNNEYCSSIVSLEFSSNLSVPRFHVCTIAVPKLSYDFSAVTLFPPICSQIVRSCISECEQIPQG